MDEAAGGDSQEASPGTATWSYRAHRAKEMFTDVHRNSRGIKASDDPTRRDDSRARCSTIFTNRHRRRKYRRNDSSLSLHGILGSLAPPVALDR
ncbi:MAG: hypothetical protein ACYTG0_03465 [Planctomycetota bacterium]|jgi:hypothetical protein